MTTDQGNNYMNKSITLTASAALLSGLFSITGCSSSGGDDDGGTTGTTGATVPANAIVIDDTNAESTVAASVTTIDTLNGAVFAVETTPVMGLKDALALVKPRIEDAKNALKNSGADPVNGVTVNDSGNCVVSGTFSSVSDEGGTSPSFTDSGTLSFVNCDDGFGYILNGSVSFNDSFNIDTGDYSDTLTGTISIEGNGSLTFKISLGGIDYAENGNDLVLDAETYTVTKAIYSVDFTADGVNGGGFLVGLTAAIVESNGGFNSCPESGTIHITGANNTTADGIYNVDGTMTIKANGVVVNPAAQCYF